MDGAIIAAAADVAFGGAWGLAGATGLPRPWRIQASIFSIAISVALIITLVIAHRPATGRRFPRPGL